MQRYDQILSELFVRFPSVTKAGFSAAAYKPGLEHMYSFDSLLGHPSEALKTIHVAGTNGKGSVSSMLASNLAAGGLRVGLFTSPHLLDFRERIKIVEGDSFRLIPKEDVLRFVDRRSADFDRLELSFFEITTGMAFDWFVREGVDIAVIEVGLGGRLDSTNILTPELSIVTSIGLDHCAQLGPTRAAIAREKAGIFKPGVPALVGERDTETAPVFEEVSAAAPCPLFFADSWADSLFPAGSRLPELDLRGEYQALNLRTVLAALDLMGIEPDWDALAHTAARTGLRGRWETLCSRPLTICDIGHNPPALRRNFAQLKEMMAGGRYPQLHIIYGIMADKALNDIIPLMPRDAAYYFVTPDTPRALPAAEIAARFLAAADRTDQASVVPSGSGRGVRKVSVCASVAETIAQVEKNASPDDLIYIGGSTFVVCEAIRYFESL